MRVLIVSPRSDIQADSELIAAAGQNTPTILNGIVTAREVINHISSGHYDAVHFAAHGNRRALEMSDGLIDDIQLQQAFEAAVQRGKPVQVAVFNACKSIGAAMRIYGATKGGPSFVVSWRDDVSDEEAQFFAVRFWRAVSAGGYQIREAYEDASEAFQRAYPDSEAPLLLNGIKAMLDQLAREVARQNTLIEELRNPPDDWQGRQVRNSVMLYSIAGLAGATLFVAVLMLVLVLVGFSG